MNPELHWCGIRVGDLVAMGASRQHAEDLSPGLVTDIVNRASWRREYHQEYKSDWPLLQKSVNSLSGEVRIRVLHANGTLKLWRPDELVTLKG